jgi:hypothetical protein
MTQNISNQWIVQLLDDKTAKNPTGNINIQFNLTFSIK